MAGGQADCRRTGVELSERGVQSRQGPLSGGPHRLPDLPSNGLVKGLSKGPLEAVERPRPRNRPLPPPPPPSPFKPPNPPHPNPPQPPTNPNLGPKGLSERKAAGRPILRAFPEAARASHVPPSP